MKFCNKISLPAGLFWGIIFLLFSTSIVQAENFQGKSLKTDIVIRAMTDKEKIQNDKAVRQSITPHQSDAEKFVDGANTTFGTIAGSGQPITDNLIDGAKNFSKNNISKVIQKVNRVDARTAQKIVKSGKSTLKSAGKYFNAADKGGTAGSVLGSVAGGDAAGAAEGLADGALSGATAGAASAGAIFLAGAASTSIYGAPLGPLGMAAAGIAGGIAGSIIYSEVGAPQVRKAGDWAANKINDAKEAAEKTRRRIRVDYITVYPDGAIGVNPEDLDPQKLHSQAEAIRIKRRNDPSVPSTYGLDREAATQALINAGFSPSVSVGKPAEDAASENKVYGQSLKAGHKAELGTSVFITVYDKYITTTIVPNAIGLKARFAGDAIRGADLIYKPVVGDPAGDMEDQFKTYSQDPVAGTEVNKQTPVKVLIYSKFAEKEMTVPNVKGLGASEAQIRITELGLTPILVKGEPAPDPAQTNTVKSQTPVAGTIFKNKGTVILTLYDMDKKNAHCRKSEGLFSAALGNNLIKQCGEILSDAVECPFYASAVTRLERHKCLQAQTRFNTAITAKRFTHAKEILAQNGTCEFALGGAMASLKCAENKSAIDSMLHRNDMGGVKSVLSSSKNCYFYPSYMAALDQVEKKVAHNKKNQERFWQMLGGVVAGLNNAAAMNSNNSSGGNAVNTGPPVVHQGTCNDVRKAGGDRPEQHIIDIGRSGKTFRFDYQTHSQEDMVIVSQGGQVLFNSGCVGTGTTKTIVLKKRAFKSEVTVDIRPNCKGGKGTAWEFKVHCPE
ncbi:PASTA domain-containing protein [uncultured Desulfuromusa sp.]|uniref:PASTA domain-containing protein n=1 Tax=uncultured Desulfuromusa sp. TaxID=219183 RepID=UPI002AA61C9F|nr:PASTA domain-containing protein [uncultured Desulfuromusa sp.]